MASTRSRRTAHAQRVVLSFGKPAFTARLDGLLQERAALDAKIEEMQQWIALCDSQQAESE